VPFPTAIALRAADISAMAFKGTKSWIVPL